LAETKVKRTAYCTNKNDPRGFYLCDCTPLGIRYQALVILRNTSQMERLRPVLGIIGIVALCSGAFLIATNFTTLESSMLKPGFLTPEKWQAGLLGTGLILLGLSIFAWLLRGTFMLKPMDSQDLKRSTSQASLARKTANEKGYFILFLLAMILLTILYYAFRQ